MIETEGFFTVMLVRYDLFEKNDLVRDCQDVLFYTIFDILCTLTMDEVGAV